mmetsp:Transcript_13119/g.31912  ORF Transcript_13119/g.31912 Transcript_13119/m.31912 type:complete len:226 (-) Transcript_13119:480-1157(-)
MALIPPFPRHASTSSTTTVLTEFTRTPPRVTIWVSSVGVPMMTCGGSAQAQARWRALEDPCRMGMIMILLLLLLLLLSLSLVPVSSSSNPSLSLSILLSDDAALAPTPSLRATLTTCRPSSRVGTTTSACTADLDASISLRRGRRYASVFPDPVCACKITSGASLSSSNCTSFCCNNCSADGDNNCDDSFRIALLGNITSRARRCSSVGFVYPNSAARSRSHWER